MTDMVEKVAEGQLDAVRPRECRDIDHVPPKAFRAFWIYNKAIYAALKPSESLSTEKG